MAQGQERVGQVLPSLLADFDRHGVLGDGAPQCDGQRSTLMGPSSCAMRLSPLAWLSSGLLAWLLLLLPAATAWAGESRRDLDGANAALSSEPPRRDAARADLRAAIAAKDEPEAVAEADFLLGRLDEDDGAYPQAMADDAACIAAGPATRWAFRASDRLDWLRARSEADFGPLRRLESVRRDPSLSSDPATLDALARDAARFPPGMVRVEARMLLAEAWLGRLHRPDDAVTMLRLVTEEKKIDPLTMRLAEHELVDALVAQGRLDEAIAEVTAHPTRLDNKFVIRVKRLRTRRAVRLVALGVLGAFGALVLFGLLRGRRQLGEAARAVRALAPTAILFVGFVAAGGGLLASKYETGNAEPFLLFGAGLLPIILVARAWSAVGSQAPAARIGRSFLCAATVAAAAFMLLESVNPQYLEGFRL